MFWLFCCYIPINFKFNYFNSFVSESFISLKRQKRLILHHNFVVMNTILEKKIAKNGRHFKQISKHLIIQNRPLIVTASHQSKYFVFSADVQTVHVIQNVQNVQNLIMSKKDPKNIKTKDITNVFVCEKFPTFP